MPDVLPHWHPAAVHFPIALSLTAAFLLLLAKVAAPRPAQSCITGAHLLLPLTALSALIAAAFGWHAFNTAEHDAAGHIAMLGHRNWALAATAVSLVLAAGLIVAQRAGRPLTPWITFGSVLLAGLFVVTGWRGGELVYRHGIGVQLPPVSCPETPACSPAPMASVPAPSAPPQAKAGEPHVHADGKRHRH